MDVEAVPSPLDTRSWRWLRVRVSGLLADERTRLHQALAPRQKRPTYRNPGQVPRARPRRR